MTTPRVKVDTSKRGVVNVIVEGAEEDDTYDVEIDMRGGQSTHEPTNQRTSWLERLRSALFDG